jgi:Zn-dependent protease with chaperone function
MDGRNATDHPVSVVIRGEDVAVVGGAGAVLARFAMREARVHPVGDGTLVHVEADSYPNAVLTLDDVLFVASLRGGGAGVRAPVVGKRALAVGLGCFAAFAALMAAFYLVAPRLSEALARRVPPSVEQRLAPQMQSLFLRNACTSPRAADAVRALLERVAPEQRGKVDIRIVNVDVPNAFALPGNVVLFTRGLLVQAETPEEIAGVLAHELSHVAHRHALSHMIRGALLGGLWAATIGDYSGMMVVDPKTAYDAATLRHSREAEAEADAGALETLTRRRISSKGLVAFLSRIGKLEPKGLTWLSSHPSSADRVSRLSRQTLSGPTLPVLEADAMYDLRKACESEKPPRSLRELFF